MPPRRVAGIRDSAMPWIELSDARGSIFMQATNDTPGQRHRGRGRPRRHDSHTIWLSEQDMDDVFAILSARSPVVIQQR